MIGALGGYIQNIGMIIIFATVVSLIMPKGDFEKYIKMVLGLIIMVAILSPIQFIIFKNKPNYTDILQKYETQIENTSMQYQNNLYLESQGDIILEHYRQTLTPQIIGVVEKSTQVQVLNLEISFNQDIESSEFGSITHMDIVVEATRTENDEKTIKIPKIRVGTKGKPSYMGDDEDSQIEQNIKKCLIDFYNLANANINITVQKNS